jgi:hypothetical protein
MRKVKHILFGFLMAMLFFPMLQNQTKLFTEKKLMGAYDLLPKPRPIADSIFSGIYMSRMNDYVEQNIGLRPTLVRLNNQLDYSLYRLPHSQGVLVGKEGQLLEEDYITEYLGRNFIGQKTIARKAEQLKFLQDYLKMQKNIDLVVVLSPSKVRFYPEDIPVSYEPNRKSISNYQCFIDNFNSKGLKYIDFSSWFVKIKKDSKYPIFPQTGIHWTDYGSLLAFDSLMRYVEAERKIDLPEMITSRIEMSTRARSVDADLWSVMNLLCYIPHPQLAYPVLDIKNKPGETRPRLLTVGDSYYWNWFYNAVPQKVFSDPIFWLYNRQIYDSKINGNKFTDKTKLKEQVEKSDVIILMVTERFLYTAFWNFTEELYTIYNPKISAEDILLEYGGKIRLFTEWFKVEIQKAHQMNMSIEAMINRDAAYTYGEEFKKRTNPGRDDYLLLNEILIWGDSAKLENAMAEAKSLNITPAQLISQKAAEQYDAEHSAKPTSEVKPGTPHDKIATIKANEKKIRSDKNWMQSIKKKAYERHITVDEMIKIDAEWMYEQDQKK